MKVSTAFTAFLVVLAGIGLTAGNYYKNVTKEVRLEIKEANTRLEAADLKIENLLKAEAELHDLRIRYELVKTSQARWVASKEALQSEIGRIADKPEDSPYGLTAYYDLDKALSFYTREQLIQIEDAIVDNSLPGLLVPILLAIGRAENGGPGKEFGILNDKANTYRKQAGWCAATIRKNFERWEKSDSEDPFIEYLGKIYCPVGAENDPTGLNKHWITNVTNLVKVYQPKA